MKSTLLTSVCFLFFLIGSSQIMVNEYSCSNYTLWNQGLGWDSTFEDWIEFYNPTDMDFALGGYWLSDNSQDPLKWQIDESVVVPAQGFLVYLLSGTGDYDSDYVGYTMKNTNFKVTQSKGEEIVFSSPEGIILEMYDFSQTGSLRSNHSFARSADGSTEWKICLMPSINSSNNNSPMVQSYCPKVDMSHQAGYYSQNLTLSLTTVDPELEIRFTLDGTEPNENSTLYTEPLLLQNTTVVKAISFSDDVSQAEGFVETNTFFFNDDVHTLPVVSVSGNFLGDGSWTGDELTTLEFFGSGGAFLDEAHGDSNEHGNDANAANQRGFDFITRDSRGYDHELDIPIFHHRVRNGFERLVFKAGGVSNYPFYSGGTLLHDAFANELSILGDLNLDERAGEFVIVYLNGEYWGVYQCLEKVDDSDFTKKYYNEPKGHFDLLNTWGGTWAEYGDMNDWFELIDFATSQDLEQAVNYSYMQNEVELSSLIDYFILNTYLVNQMWVNWDISWWKGSYPQGNAQKWRYTLWDSDATLGNYINYTGLPESGYSAAPCQINAVSDIGSNGHFPLFNALWENADFRCAYISRYYELTQNILSCESAISVLDSLEQTISGEMIRHTDKWGGSVQEWESNIEEMRTFLNSRCGSLITSLLQNCYDESYIELTVNVEGPGSVSINGTEVNAQNSPYQLSLCSVNPITLEVMGAFGCGIFDGWNILEGSAMIELLEGATSLLSGWGEVDLLASFSGSPETLNLLVDIQSDGQGIVIVNQNELLNFPSNVEFEEGSLSIVNAIPTQGYVFDHWEADNLDLNPDPYSSSVEFVSCENSELTAVFSPFSGLLEGTLRSEILVFPNPTTDEIMVHWINGLSRIYIINSLGERVKSVDVFGVNSVLIPLDLSSGLYSIQTSDGEIVRFIIQ
jgi:CotH kinase protein/Chitobiase/beta-hexosaminidase C-terminal domain